MNAERAPYKASHRILAVLAVLALVFGGGWAAITPDGGVSAAAGKAFDLLTLVKRLSPPALASASATEAAAATRELARESRLAGIDPRTSFEEAFPAPCQVLGMLAIDRDVSDFLEYGGREDAAGLYYRAEAAAARDLRPLRSRYEAVYSAAYAALTDDDRRDVAADGKTESAAAKPLLKRPYVAAPGEVWLPSRDELALSHPYALDIFFQNIERTSSGQLGPTIRALLPGIVVASASDWDGGQGISEWKGGGLSPASGNGLVIYDPASRRYCSYFHLSSISFRAGDIVAAGDAIGRGGNTGMNARKPDHGGHLHLEIFDAARDESLSSAEILALLRR